jgi:hypothetical protein
MQLKKIRRNMTNQFVGWANISGLRFCSYDLGATDDVTGEDSAINAT